jgi:micrococcal nuclease
VLFLLFSLLFLISGVSIFLPNRWVKRGMALLNGKWADLPYERWHAVVAFFIACFLLIAITDLAPIQQLQAAQLNKTEQALEKEKQALKAKEKELKEREQEVKQLQSVYRQTLSERNDLQKKKQQMEITIKQNEAKIKQLEVQVKTLQGQLAQQQQKKSVAAAPQPSQSVPATQKKPPSSKAGSGGRSAPVSASGGDRDCDDFLSQVAAQSYFDSHGGSPSNNVDGLDRDHDGIACENLP